jgi:DNA-nicking Smr family endonuclease
LTSGALQRHKYNSKSPGRLRLTGLLHLGLFQLHPDEPVRIPITDIFDLHSVPPKDVQAVVEEYLHEAHRLGLRALRIIHGRGIGVQREIVRSILSRTAFVLDYRDAPPEAGGWGATIVELRD